MPRTGRRSLRPTFPPIASLVLALGVLALGVLAGPGGAAPTAAAGTAAQDRALSAVGRLWVGTEAVCEATLIAPRVAMTAAQCLFEGTEVRPRDLDSLRVLLDWRDGRPAQRRWVQAVGMHPGFQPAGTPGQAPAGADIALLGLAPSLTGAVDVPFLDLGKSRTILVGQRVTLVNRAEASDRRGPRVQTCAIRTQREAAVTVQCPGPAGPPGTPIIVSWGMGPGQILAVLSATGDADDRAEAPATLAAPTMSALWDALCSRWDTPHEWACLQGQTQPDSLLPW